MSLPLQAICLARIIEVTIAALVLLALSFLGWHNTSWAEGFSFDKAQTEIIEGIIRTYLLEHPELVVEVTAKLHEREEVARQVMIRANLNKLRADLEHDRKTPVLGNPDGNVTIVEFYDYRCGYCKVVYRPLIELIKEDSHIKLVLKDLPLLGPDSYTVAKAALAAHAQNKYAAFMEAGMAHRGLFDSETINAIVQRIGLDMVQFRKDLDGAELDQQLEKNRNLARVLDLAGTPVFIIGDMVVPGALSEGKMRELVARARIGR